MFGKFTPDQISLTDEQFTKNMWRLEHNTDIDVNQRVKQAKEYAKRGKEYMLQDIRGGLLDIHTKEVEIKINGHKEKTVVAKKEIPAGSILGMYFGTKKEGITQHEADISKKIVLRIGTRVQSFFSVVGELDKEQTRIATINHAFSQYQLEQRYILTDKAKKNVAVANVGTDYFNVTYTDKSGKVQEFDMEVYIAEKDICSGEVLLWSYDPAPTSYLNSFFRENTADSERSYWRSRGITPLLFTREGELLSQTDYFPSHFNVKIHNEGDYDSGYSFAIPYTLVPQLMSQSRADISEALNQLPHVNEGDIEEIQSALKATGFLSPQGMEAIKSAARKEIISSQNTQLAKTVGWLLLIGFVYLLTKSDTQQRQSQPSFFSSSNIVKGGLSALFIIKLLEFGQQLLERLSNSSSMQEEKAWRSELSKLRP